MRERPSAEVNSVMMRPQPDCWLVVAMSTSGTHVSDARRGAPASEVGVKRLAFLMKRRKTVSVTPAIGASTVAGAMLTLPIDMLAGTRECSGIACSAGESHFF